jgi:hypothetical protein
VAPGREIVHLGGVGPDGGDRRRVPADLGDLDAPSMSRTWIVIPSARAKTSRKAGSQSRTGDRVSTRLAICRTCVRSTATRAGSRVVFVVRTPPGIISTVRVIEACPERSL